MPVRSEFDLAAGWDDRPVARRHRHQRQDHGHHAVARHAGALGPGRRWPAATPSVPLVAAIDDPAADVFVVEACRSGSSHTAPLRARVGDVAELRRRPPRRATPTSAATRRPRPASGATRPPTTSPSSTPTTRSWPATWPASARQVAPSASAPGDGHGASTASLVGPDGAELVAVDDLRRGAAPRPGQRPGRGAWPRRSAAAATPRPRPRVCGLHGASPTGWRWSARLAACGWYDDSKATTPHATVAAVAGFDSVVLIAGGPQQGPRPRRCCRRPRHASGRSWPSARPRPRSRRPSPGCARWCAAGSMDEAVRPAAGLARAGRRRLLSPGLRHLRLVPVLRRAGRRLRPRRPRGGAWAVRARAIGRRT